MHFKRNNSSQLTLKGEPPAQIFFGEGICDEGYILLFFDRSYQVLLAVKVNKKNAFQEE
jgi:hypothetical protein